MHNGPSEAEPTPPPSLAHRAITSSFWRVVASGLTLATAAVRSIALARLLPVETFGVYAFASSIVGLGGVVTQLGMTEAFLYRSPEVRDEQSAASVHFTLVMVSTAVWTAAMIAGTLLLSSGALQGAILALVASHAVLQLSVTPHVVLLRRVSHRRLAALDLGTALATTVVCVGLALGGFGLWSLLAYNGTVAVLHVVALYGWRPVWRPRPAWSSETARYLVSFGARNVLGTLLWEAQRRVDKLWLGTTVGATALGFYSRAFSYARSGAGFFADPVSSVAGGTFAELHADRRRLSQAVFRSSAALVRVACAICGAGILVGHDVTAAVLGDKWLPMLDALYVLLFMFVLRPVTRTLGQLMLAVGRPAPVLRVRLAELATLVVGLAALAPTLGIIGGAIAAVAATVVGLAFLVTVSRAHVDLSVVRVFAAPLAALALGLLAGWGVGAELGEARRVLRVLAQSGAFSLAYALVLVALERREIAALTSTLRRALLRSEPVDPPEQGSP